MHHHFISRFTLSHQAPQKAEKSVKEAERRQKSKYAKTLSHALSCGQTVSTYFKSVALYNSVLLAQSVFYL